MLQTFLPLFAMTFGICLFIILMQFLWRYVDEMVGKGLELHVLAEMFFYAALSFVPTALPLAILLASLMTFGNIGESLELLAMKSSGVSLLRIMKPLIITVSFIAGGAFCFQNYIIPVSQVKMYTLLFSIRQKSPELEIPVGIFCKEIPGYNVYIKGKDPKTGLLKDIMIYNYSEGFNNAYVVRADSGRLKTSANKLYLILSLFNGESFQNLNTRTSNRSSDAVSYQRESFSYKDILINFDANFSRTDESLMQSQYIGKNLADLQTSLDSMTVRLDSARALNAKSIYDLSYKRTLTRPEIKSPLEKTKSDAGLHVDEEEGLPDQPVVALSVPFDSAFFALSPGMQLSVLNRAKSSIESTRSDYMFKSFSIADEAKKVRRYQTEMYKKFTLSFACLVFFFIGAPLGAIIRKGGLGMPVVISVFLFIFYYIIDNIGFKMATNGIWQAWQGMWLSSAILTPLGVFLTYKATNDSVILNADTYLNAFKKLIGKSSNRKIEKKEVVIYNPDYPAISARLQKLIADNKSYLDSQRKWIGYFSFWQTRGKDDKAKQIATEVESIVEELSNSDQILILNKLMDYPVLIGYDLFSEQVTPKLGRLFSIFFPVGLPLYLLANYRRKLMWQDMQAISKINEELQEMINKLINK